MVEEEEWKREGERGGVEVEGVGTDVGGSEGVVAVVAEGAGEREKIEGRGMLSVNMRMETARTWRRRRLRRRWWLGDDVVGEGFLLLLLLLLLLVSAPREFRGC